MIQSHTTLAVRAGLCAGCLAQTWPFTLPVGSQLEDTISGSITTCSTELQVFPVHPAAPSLLPVTFHELQDATCPNASSPHMLLIVLGHPPAILRAVRQPEWCPYANQKKAPLPAGRCSLTRLQVEPRPAQPNWGSFVALPSCRLLRPRVGLGLDLPPPFSFIKLSLLCFSRGPGSRGSRAPQKFYSFTLNLFFLFWAHPQYMEVQMGAQNLNWSCKLHHTNNTRRGRWRPCCP